jgi:hypothetical protein
MILILDPESSHLSAFLDLTYIVLMPIFIITFRSSPTLLTDSPHIIIQTFYYVNFPMCIITPIKDKGALGEEEVCSLTSGLNEHTQDGSQNTSEPALISIERT